MNGRLAVHRHTFEAMGSTVELVLVGGARRKASARFAPRHWPTSGSRRSVGSGPGVS